MKRLRAVESSPAPLYSQVRESLRERIVDGTFAPHSQLPAESEIGTIFGVSRITVRQALSDLQKEGVIFKVPGKGTYVSKPKAYQELAQLEGFGEAMSRNGHEIFNRVVSHESVPAAPQVAESLCLATGTVVTEIKRVRYLNHEPVSLEVTYVPEEIGNRLLKENLANRDIFLILENDCRIELGRADLQIGAISADAVLAEALRVDEGTALLRIERLTHGADGKPLDFEYLYVRGDASQYRLQLTRHAVNKVLP
jgi:GntR family transcriptional regulator